MATLLEDLRSLGYEIHFAGVDLSAEEKRETQKLVDRWIHDFVWPAGDKSSVSARIRRRLIVELRQALSRLYPDGTSASRFGNRPLDDWFHPAWVAEVRRIQKVGSYRRVLVSYVIHSAFFAAFDSRCLKILDCHDVFTDRNAMLSESKLDPVDHWFSLSRDDERRGLLRAGVILAIQEREARYFDRLTYGRRVVRTVGHIIPPDPQPFRDDQSLVMGFLASANPLNRIGLEWFFEEVWPVLGASDCDGKLVVAGGICDVMSFPPDVDLLGTLPSPRVIYQLSLFMINPMPSGTGLKIKTVEAMAHGRAIVSTPAGVDGMALAPGVSVAETAEEFVAAILNYLLYPAEAQKAGAAAAEHLFKLRNQSLNTLVESFAMTSN